MITSTTIKTIANTNDQNAKPVPITIPKGPGVVQGKKILKLFIPNTSTKNLNIQIAIGAKINVIKNTIKIAMQNRFIYTKEGRYYRCSTNRFITFRFR